MGSQKRSISLQNYFLFSQILRPIKRHTVAAQDTAVSLVDKLAVEDNHAVVMTLEVDKFARSRLDDSN
jgi:hypothetical protein